MFRNFLFGFLVLVALVGCKKEGEPQPNGNEAQSSDSFISFKFEKHHNSHILERTVECDITANKITGFSPSPLSSDMLVATFSVPGGRVTVNQVVQTSGVTQNDFSKPVVYSVTSKDGQVKNITVSLTSFTRLPILEISTENQSNILSKEDYVNGYMKVRGNGLLSEGLYQGNVEIRGRGNSTWSVMPKKPYKIKLAEKARLLDMPADKDWVLLANYADKTLLRNHIALNLARNMGLPFTPRSRFVEVFINGQYQGNYLLAEQIKVAKDRVNIRAMGPGDESPENITGGYLLEVDVRLDADHFFLSPKGVSICIKSPKNISQNQLAYINQYVKDTEAALYGENFQDEHEGYAKFLNPDSFVRWYLLNELCRNHDAAFYTSVFLYKDRLGKLNMGPAWDFDISIGNINYNNAEKTEGWYIRKSLWIERLFEDPAFRKKVKDTWNALKNKEIASMQADIAETANMLSFSQKENFRRWPILDKYVWPNFVVPGSYEGEIAYLYEWLGKRIAWMDQEISQSSF